MIFNMNNFKITLFLASFALMANFGYAQDTTKSVSKLDVVVSIGGNILGGQQTKEKLLENPFLSTNYDNCTVLSYKVVFTRNGVEDAPLHVSGSRFTEAVISKIKSYPAGTAIEIVDIQIKCGEDKRTVVTPLIVLIK
jgi:hypothetical protein